jgi:hypothetical protein
MQFFVNGDVMVLGLCGLALLAGAWLIRDWWLDNRAGGR